MTELEHLHIQRRVLGVCIIIAVLGSSIACTRGPKGLSRSAYLAAEKTVSAIKRANEYRDAGVLLFEPRFLEAEREADGMMALRNNASDSAAADIARSCVKDLTLYREIQTIHLNYLNRPPSPNFHQKALDDYDDQQMVGDAREAIDGCIATLSGYM